MKNRRNYYRILQVQPDAPLEIIRTSYHTLMRELMQHPDLGGDHWNACIINEAYETLSDSVKRAEYDKKHLKDFPHYTASRPDSGKKTFTWSNRPAAIPAMSDKKFHRSVNRVKINGKLRCYSDSSNKRLEAEILDLSPEGIRFACSEKLMQESIFRIECSLFQARAEVVNFNKNLSTDKPVYSVGARFLTVRFRNQKGSFYSNFV